MDARDAITRWLADGLIDDELADRLRATIDDDDRGNLTQFLIRIGVFLGAVLIGGGLLLFISSQWDEQSPHRRLLLLLAVYLVIIGAAAVAESRRLATTARGLWFLSSIAVGVNIFLTGQIFNLPLNYWQGTLLWMVASLFMGWAAPSTAQGWLVITLGLLTLGWISTPSSQFFDQGAFLFDEGGIRALLPLIGLALVAASMLLGPTDFHFLDAPALNIGVLLIAGPLTVSTFHPEAFRALTSVDAGIFHAVVAVAALAIIGLAYWQHRVTLLGPVLAVIVALLVVVLPQVDGSDGSASWLAEPFEDSELLFGIYTAAIFILALGTIALGQKVQVTALVNTGFTVVAVLAVAVYIGRIAGALPTSLAVLLGGILLVGGAVLLERRRRDVLEGQTS